MENKNLNSLKIGEQLVEMQECSLHDMNVFEVTLYKCVSICGFRKIKKYTFPFYFTSKELVEGFLKFYNYFKLCIDHLRWSNETCFSLKVSGIDCCKFHMVDAYKKKFYNDNYYNYRWAACKLDNKGIWDGELNDTSEMHPQDMNSCYNYMQLLDKCNIPVKSEKTYIFKMIESC